MAYQDYNGIVVNKLKLEQYRNLKENNQLENTQSYVISDIDEYTYKYVKSEDSSNPIILRNLDTGLYKIYGYFKYYSSYSGISAVDPFAYVIVEKGSSYSYVTVVSSNSAKRYKITNNSYEDLDDSGWKEATLNSGFTNYGAGTTPEYRKIGNIVEIRGSVKPTSEITGSTNGITIFTLPEGFRPTKDVLEVCQGSGRNVWLLNIKTSGAVTIARYGTTSIVNIPTSAWLCFNKMFSI